MIRRLSLLLGVVLLLGLPVAHADEVDAASAPSLRLEDLDLLPLHEFELQDLRAAHPKVVQRLQGLAYQLGKKKEQLAKRAKKDDEAGKALQKEIARLRRTAAPLLVEATGLLRAYGLTDAMLERMAAAPTGEHRLERYAHHLVLLLDLREEQRTLLERVVAEVDGSILALKALEERTRLVMKQADLEKGAQQAVLQGFRRQLREIDRRFWRLVYYVLDVDQAAALWTLLPASIRRHDSAVDHVYALPSLTPSQGGRVRALVTEIEAESAPDQALVRRLGQQMKDGSLSKEERQAAAKTRSEGYRRLSELRRAARGATLEILTPEQVHELRGIPPRVSINDRRENGRRILEGMALDADQQAAIARLRQEGNRAAKRYRERMSEIRSEMGDVGPDSPQSMMMEMMMAGARGQTMVAQRALLGRVFLDVLEPDQVTGWVMGLYGYRR